ncbi:hypothetical protein RND81_01G030100 [Saponaria officinalis]|uniref:Phosphoserine aminotransferase n=1 Tax=Saponaria officinalis TaxID=3572 RepID=A0AAW1NDQ2_SAPOF
MKHLERIAAGNRFSQLHCGAIASCFAEHVLEDFGPEGWIELYPDEEEAREHSFLNHTHVRDKLLWINDANDWFLKNQVICCLSNANLLPLLPLPHSTEPTPRPNYCLVAPQVPADPEAAPRPRRPTTQRRGPRTPAAAAANPFAAGPSFTASGSGTAAAADPSFHAGPYTFDDYARTVPLIPPRVTPPYGPEYEYFIPYPTGPQLPPFHGTPPEVREQIIWDSQKRIIDTLNARFLDLSLSITSSTSSTATDRVFNFADGPAVLSEPVIRKALEDILIWNGSGMSFMEMCHRGKEFTSIIDKAESDLRSLLNIPIDEFSFVVLFLQGGATSQFSAVSLNLCSSPQDHVDYLITGSWGDKAAREVAKYSSVSFLWSGKGENYVRVPDFGSLKQNPRAKYLHICANETIYGAEFKDYLTSLNEEGLLVADMSSTFCSKTVDVSKFGVIYTGAQKNVGPAGVTIVIVRRDLIGKSQKNTPVMLDYKIHAENKSLYNTPPCFGIYMYGLVFEDLLQQGGLEEVENKNVAKGQLLYDAIDNGEGFFRCPVKKLVRSLMNVPFRLVNSELEGQFIKQAAKEKMVTLKRHRSVGGMRASIYNAMPLAGVQKMVAFMKDYQARHS